MPDFEDPYDLNRPLPLFRQRNNPLTIGSDDLNPHPNPYNIMGGEGGIGPMGLPRPQPGREGCIWIYAGGGDRILGPLEFLLGLDGILLDLGEDVEGLRIRLEDMVEGIIFDLNSWGLGRSGFDREQCAFFL